MKKIFEGCATLIYLIAATILTLMSLLIMGRSVYEVFTYLILSTDSDNQFISTMLQSVGAVIISVAVLDVAKYIVEEEVLRNKELRLPKEARETVTKIIVIVSIAVSIEGLVFIFKAGAEDIRLLIYPGFLIITAGFIIIGLGLYQKLSVDSEHSKNE